MGKNKKHPNDLKGMRFDRLKVLYLDTKKTDKYKYWICKCDCGNIKSAPHYGLLRGHTKSCGCKYNTKTQKEYLAEVAYKNPNIEVLGEYVGGHQKIKVKCKVCNHIWDVDAGSIVRNKPSGCPKCFLDTRNKTDISVVKSRLANLLNGDFELVGQFNGQKNKSLFLHKKCGNKFFGAYDVVIKYKNSICPCCRIDNYENTLFLNHVKELYGDEYSVLDECKSSLSRLRVKHNICDTIFETEARHILSGRLGCRHCSNCELWNTNRFKEEVEKISGGEHTVISDYIDSQTKINIRHNICGVSAWVKPNSFINNNGGCSFCRYEALRKSETDFFNDFATREDSYNYEFLSEYIDYKSKMLIKSKNCGHTYFATPNRLLSDKSTCPICYKSKGEDRIMSYLEKNNIKYTKEKTYPNLVGLGGGLLRYDYLIWDGDIPMLCEYQGEQHSRFIKGFHKNKEAFEKQVAHDNIKKDYAMILGIELLEIQFYEFDNIEKILDNKLKCLNMTA